MIPPLIIRLGKTTWWHLECTICHEKFDYKAGKGMITCPNCGISSHTMWL
jgi:predicted RNA-binding Zn-ribbon protein involved in translation (DUF1610 family)